MEDRWHRQKAKPIKSTASLGKNGGISMFSIITPMTDFNPHTDVGRVDVNPILAIVHFVL